ncbi:glutathione peroxidase [Flavihumibacter profundi]|uniref:glutathione peroxidase n=1 Tax=Flavihumibacter profundi TaxID=2716883 RepID=UPI001CC358A0|nr:glutathione peroxidase [Flavihumibacter profundi]MBZ5857887.1 glutathione peroxidase [Flavihumibacter profundi]
MSKRQQVLKWFYPALMKAGRLLGSKEKHLVNKDMRQPLRSFYSGDITLTDGSQLSIDSLRGKKVFIVNTASDCGYTAQYESLQKLYERFEGKLVIIAFPANDFKQQEKSDDKTIAEFCRKNYNISFPLAKKTTVIKGPAQNPVFYWLTNSSSNGWCDQVPEWNFSKYLVNENGILMHYFAAGISPLDPSVIKAIED